MFKAPFITSQSKALRRANASVVENAYRLYAFTHAQWDRALNFGIVEEEAREAFVLLSLGFRRSFEIFGLEKSALPSMQAVSKRPGVWESVSVSEITNVGAHLQYFALHLGSSETFNDVGFVNARSDDRGVYFKPGDFINACLSVLPQMTADAYEERSLQLANNLSSGAK